MDLETAIAELVSVHGPEKVQKALSEHITLLSDTTDGPPGSTNPPPPKP